MGGISIWQLVIVLVIVMLLFGTKKLRNMGSDLGGAVKGFKKAVTDEEKKPLGNDSGEIIDAKAENAEEEKPKS